MAHYEVNAIVRISTIQTSPTALTAATRLSVVALDYANNNSVQEESGRISLTQMMTTRRAGGYDGYFSHCVANSAIDALASKANHLLPTGYRSGGERPLGAANGVEFGEMSCALPSHNPTGASVGIQTLNSSYYSDNAVDNSSLVEFR